MHGNVALNGPELYKLYRESFVLARKRRLVFTHKRRFQEVLGAQLESAHKTLKMGQVYNLTLNFPADMPSKNKNWFEVAFSNHDPDLIIPQPFNCPVDKLGFMVGQLATEPLSKAAEFYFEDRPLAGDVDYAMFIYQTEHPRFIKAVEDALLAKKPREVMDEEGRRILISSESFRGQSAALVPLTMLVGGKEYACQVWNRMRRAATLLHINENPA